jgi:hypothetical protein
MRHGLSDGQDCSSTIAPAAFPALKPVQLWLKSAEKSGFNALMCRQPNSQPAGLKIVTPLKTSPTHCIYSINYRKPLFSL